jgi:hypothetical protein
MATFKFWQFGCWNNLNTIDGVVQGRANDVMTFIKKKLDEADPPDKLIISGDNYYPHKIEDKKKDKSQKDKSQKDKSPKEETSKKKDKSPKGEQSEKGDKSPKEETSKKLEKAPSTTKEKTIYTEVLKAGLLSLPVDIPITMILGNHDLDRNILFYHSQEEQKQIVKKSIIDKTTHFSVIQSYLLSNPKTFLRFLHLKTVLWILVLSQIKQITLQLGC